jgi:hypothetical protein
LETTGATVGVILNLAPTGAEVVIIFMFPGNKNLLLLSFHVSQDLKVPRVLIGDVASIPIKLLPPITEFLVDTRELIKIF